MKASAPPPALSDAELIVETPTECDDGQLEFACRLELPHEKRRLWWRFPRESAGLITSRADPFLIATAVHTLGRIGRLTVHGTVSEGLLANLADFQAAYAAWHGRPGVATVQYVVATASPPAQPARSNLGITAFSGGVDSCFSVYRHTAVSRLAPKRSLGAALMMHGFDIPLEDSGIFARSAARSRQLTDDAGLALHVGATNIRTLPVPWEDTFGAAVAGSLAFFQAGYAFGLVPSFQDWAHAHFDHGSNPLTDPLLSSFAFPIVHDGTTFGRIEKLQRLVEWPAALQHVRVCWQGDQLDRNCCRCEKCFRTMLMLRLCGVESCPAFPLPLDLAALERLVIKSQSGLDEFSYLLEVAAERGLHAPWITPTRRALQRNRRNRRIWRQGRALAGLVPERVRTFLRAGGHRWLWQAKNVPPVPANPPPDAARSH